jgi:6,7-dimethyl-8-ribityllumazine synthase
MLKKISGKSVRAERDHFAIIASEYNARYVDALLRNAKTELKALGAKSIKVVRVPGAFEIPVVAAALARSHLPRLSAILCLGVVFQGETSHAQHIGEAVSQALARLQVDQNIPVIHGVYHFNNESQARVRCLGKKHNRGIELARTALAMTRVMRGL